jgi:hypothetical protein
MKALDINTEKWKEIADNHIHWRQELNAWSKEKRDQTPTVSRGTADSTETLPEPDTC